MPELVIELDAVEVRELKLEHLETALPTLGDAIELRPSRRPHLDVHRPDLPSLDAGTGMTTLIRRPGLVQLPNVTPLQRRTIIYELDIRRRTYDDIIAALENHE